MTPTKTYDNETAVNVGTPGHVDHNGMIEEMKTSQTGEDLELTPEMIQQLMAMQKGASSKRGITKAHFNKAKRNARSKITKASRKANR